MLAGLADGPEIERVAARLAPLPVVAFDGVQGAKLGAEREIQLALPIAPAEGDALEDVLAGTPRTQRLRLSARGLPVGEYSVRLQVRSGSATTTAALFARRL